MGTNLMRPGVLFLGDTSVASLLIVQFQSKRFHAYPSRPARVSAKTARLQLFGHKQHTSRQAKSNYVLNRTVGDMLRSNQTISALGRLARR